MQRAHLANPFYFFFNEMSKWKSVFLLSHFNEVRGSNYTCIQHPPAVHHFPLILSFSNTRSNPKHHVVTPRITYYCSVSTTTEFRFSNQGLFTNRRLCCHGTLAAVVMATHKRASNVHLINDVSRDHSKKL